MKAESGGHGGRDVGSELTNLRVNIGEVSVTGPAAKFFDNIMVVASEFEVHGTPRAEAVGANAIEAITAGREVVTNSTHVDEAADGVGRDLGCGRGLGRCQWRC